MSVRKLSDYPAIETLLSSYDLPGHASMAQKKDPYEFYFGDESPVQFESEPGPSLKYNIIYVWAVRLAPVIRDRSQKKKFLDAFEDVADARSNYHRCSLEYRKAYNELQDTSLFHEIMTERKEEVEKQIAQWQEKGDMESVLKQKQKELETFKWQIQKNDKSGQPLLEKAQTLARIKAQVSMHFVDMKISLIKDYLPYMAILEMQCLVAMQQRAAMQHRVAMIRMAKAPSPTVQPTVEKEALKRYHQATHEEILKRMKPSPELARAIEQARIALGQSSAEPPRSTS